MTANNTHVGMCSACTGIQNFASRHEMAISTYYGMEFKDLHNDNLKRRNSRSYKIHVHQDEHRNLQAYQNTSGTAVTQRLMCCVTNRKVAGSITDDVTGIFHWHKILPIALWLWGRHSLWQKWVPGAFPGGKGGRCLRLTTLPPSCGVVMKSGNLNFLEPSGPLQACNWTALPLPFN